MDRRVIRALAAAGGILLAVVFLASCPSPFSLRDAVELEVKIANDKFLEIVSVWPTQPASNLNPGVDIAIVFDRDLDETTISDTTVTVSPLDPAFTVVYEFIGETNTLVVKGDPYFLDSTTYTVTVKQGLKGLDGSQMLEQEVSWQFPTGIYPAGSVVINEGDEATNTTNAELSFSAKPVVDKYRISLVSEAECLASGAWHSIFEDPLAVTLPDVGGLDGVKTVWVQFWDDGLDQGSTVETDTIKLDRTPPVVNSFRINKGAVSSKSTSVDLFSSVSDLSSREMRFQNVGGAWSAWEPFDSVKEWTLKSSAGTLKVNAEFRDVVGNTAAAVYDSIIYGAPTVTSATKGTAALNTVAVSFNIPLAEDGTNRYYIYRRDYPSGETYTSLGYVTDSGQAVTVPKGSWYNFHVQIYNTAVRGSGDYSSTYAPGYTTDVAIVYDSGDSADTQTATDLRNLLLTNIPGSYGPTVTGTMPSWAVMMIPQSMISTTYSAANVYGGYPLIVTPGSDLYANASQTRNVTAHSGAIFAMGEGGTRLLDTVEANWGGWGYSGTAPADIGFGESAISAASLWMRTQTASNSVWSSPLRSTSIPGGSTPTDNASVQISYASLARVSAYLPSGIAGDGWLYGREDNATSAYYPVVRQGRFLQYGFDGETDRPYTGWVYTTNLVYRMSYVYYHP